MKKTIKSPSKATIKNAGELAIQANAAAIGDLDLADTMGARTLEFGAMFDGLDVDEFKARRACWMLAYAQATGCEPTSAGTRFAEMVRAAGVTKPQSDKAKAMQAKRVAAKASQPAQPAEEPSDDVSPKAGKGAAAAAGVSMALSAFEAHVISMLRSGKFEMAAAAIAAQADKV